MKLSELSTKPKLVEIVLDDEKLVEKYGEPLQFFVKDKLPIEKYTELASIKGDDMSQMYILIKDLILDEDGNPVITDESTLPLDVMNSALMKVSEYLGK
jgi:hypothetical protein